MAALLTLNKKQTKNAEPTKRWGVAVATPKHLRENGMLHRVRNIFLSASLSTSSSIPVDFRLFASGSTYKTLAKALSWEKIILSVPEVTVRYNC